MPQITARGTIRVSLSRIPTLIHTRSANSKWLNEISHRHPLWIHPSDAEKWGVSDGDEVEVASRRGDVRTKARVTDICPEGVVSLTFHFAATPTNELTHAALDPVAKIPETKVCAVRIQKLSA